MIPRLFKFTILAVCALSVSACLPAKQFYWGSYEESLFSRQQHAGAGGEAEAATMLLATINEDIMPGYTVVFAAMALAGLWWRWLLVLAGLPAVREVADGNV